MDETTNQASVTKADEKILSEMLVTVVLQKVPIGSTYISLINADKNVCLQWLL